MNITGIILALLLLASSLQSSYHFLFFKKIGSVKWFFFNACAPWSFLYLIGFLVYLYSKNKLLLSVSPPGLIFFGLSGLIMFSWDKPTSQLGHLVMIINSIYAFWLVFKDKPIKPALSGVLIGMVCLLFFALFQKRYISENQTEFNKVMPVKPSKVN